MPARCPCPNRFVLARGAGRCIECGATLVWGSDGSVGLAWNPPALPVAAPTAAPAPAVGPRDGGAASAPRSRKPSWIVVAIAIVGGLVAGSVSFRVLIGRPASHDDRSLADPAELDPDVGDISPTSVSSPVEDTAPSTSPGPAWQRFETEDGGFAADFPGEASQQEVEPEGVGEAAQMWAVRDGNTEYSVTMTTYADKWRGWSLTEPEMIVWQEELRALDDADPNKEIPRPGHGEGLQTPVDIGGTRGREARLDLPDFKSLHIAAIKVGQRSYLLVARNAAEHYWVKFRDSFQLLG